MADRRTTRKLELFAVHAHRERGPIDYEDLFRALLDQPARTRRFGDKVLAIPTMSFDGSRVRLIAYEGAEGVDPIIFNTQNFEERVQELSYSEVVATKTHAVIETDGRRAVVEYPSWR